MSSQGASDGTRKEQRRADPKMLELLVCPLTKSVLRYDDAAQELVSRQAGLAYPIRDGVPLMTEDAARKLDDTDLEA
jgi:uncharacterized protein